MYSNTDASPDRFFIPQLTPNTSMAYQLAQCQALVGTGKDGVVVAIEQVVT